MHIEIGLGGGTLSGGGTYYDYRVIPILGKWQGIRRKHISLGSWFGFPVKLFHGIAGPGTQYSGKPK